MTQRKRRGRPISDDEAHLWQRVIATITPLAAPLRERVIPGAEDMESFLLTSTSTATGGPTASALSAPSFSDLATPEALQSLVIGEASDGRGALAAAIKPAFQPLQHGASPGVDRRTADRFRRGKMGIDGRIDLHGMTQEQAHGALHSFIESRYASGARCVLVITGKGARGEGILRRVVPRWLNDARLRPLILSFSHAQIPDGGEGALYVLLRRQREDR